MSKPVDNLRAIESDYMAAAHAKILVQLDVLQPNREQLAAKLGTHRTTLNRNLKNLKGMPAGTFFRLLRELKINPYTLHVQ